MWCINGIKGWFRFLGKILQSILVELKNFGLIVFPGLIYGDQEPLWLLNVIEDDYQFLGVHNLWGYQLDVRFGSLLGCLQCLQIIFL